MSKLTPEIQSLIKQYEKLGSSDADLKKAAKIRRQLRAKGFSLREFNKSQKKTEKPTSKKEKKAPVNVSSKPAPKKDDVEDTDSDA